MATWEDPALALGPPLPRDLLAHRQAGRHPAAA